MHAFRFVALVVAAVFAADLASAQSDTKTGQIPAGTNGATTAQVFHNNGWNDGTFFCRVGSLIVWPRSGPCLGREAKTTFTVLSGLGETNAPHDYTYHVFCGAGNIVQHEIAFDGAALTPIDSNTFTFNLTGGDTLQLVTTEGLQAVSGPALSGRAALACAALVSLGLLWMLRRRTRRTGTFS